MRWVLSSALALLFVASLAASLVRPLPVDAQDQAATAAESAAWLAELEIAADYGALYGLLHPDAQAVVPYEAMAGWYANDFWPRGPYPIEILAVGFVEWIWGVTGVTYPWAAEVAYRQTFWDDGAKTTLDAVVHLVEADSGWRWFFGGDPAFLADQIARYVAPAEEPAPAAPAATDLADWIYGDLDSFWWNVSANAGLAYASPGFVAFTGEITTPCGIATTALGPASYCPLDGTIYWETGWMATLRTEQGDGAWAAVLAHEWGHHVQALLGLSRSLNPDDLAERYPIELELQADCLSGAYLHDAAWRGLLTADDVAAAAAFAAASGDAGVPWFEAGAHGTPDMRVTSLQLGYGEGIGGCGLV